jgi:hypothetical protein
MQPPYTPEEERKIALVKALMENGVKAMFDAVDTPVEQAEKELLMAQPWEELKKFNTEKKAQTGKISGASNPIGIPHTDLWAGPTQEGGGPLSEGGGGLGQVRISGQCNPEKILDLGKLAAVRRVEELRSDLKRKLDAMYREQQAAMHVVQDYEGRIQRLNILIDDLR